MIAQGTSEHLFGTCVFGHTLTTHNTGWVAGEPYCLECVALAHRATDIVTRRIVEVLLNLAPFPTRAEVEAA